jgi:Flp pilus assembly protein TadG
VVTRLTIMPGCRALKALMRDARAAVALEFALVAPMLIGLILAVLNTALIFLAQQGLETAAENGGRIIMTGQAQQGGMTQAQFKTAACASLPPFLQCGRLYIDVTAVTNFSDATLTAPTFTYDSNGNVSNSFSYSTGARGDCGGAADVSVADLERAIRAEADQHFGGNRMLMATSVLKTEYY